MHSAEGMPAFYWMSDFPRPSTTPGVHLLSFPPIVDLFLLVLTSPLVLPEPLSSTFLLIWMGSEVYVVCLLIPDCIEDICYLYESASAAYLLHVETPLR